MVVYLDLILLLNFVIDYFILLVTGKYLNLRIKKWRLGLGAGIGALYSLVFFIPNLSVLHLFITKVLVSVLIIFISYGYIHLLQFFQTIAVFYFVSFIAGGGVFAIQYLFNIKHDVVNGIMVSHSSSPAMMIVIILVGFFAIIIFSNRTFLSLKRKSMVTDKLLEVELFINNNSYKCRGLVDTGNQLYDPISRKPVMIIEAKEVIFIPEIFQRAYQNEQFKLELFENISEQLDPSWVTRIHLVPFKSISKGMQFILTIRPDKVVINTTDDKKIEITKVLIGLSYSQLSSSQSYQAIIHPELLAG